jgi:hypothetical protein
MASRVSLIQSRSIYVGTSNSVAPSDGNLIVTGNVGIGTTSPASLLTIFGAGNTLRLDSSSGADKEILMRSVGTGTGTLKTDGNLRLWSEDSGRSIIFKTFGGESSIASTGNVLIGTTTDGGYKLDVNGKTNVSGGTITAGSETTYAFRVLQGKPITLGGDDNYAYIQSWSSGPLVLNSQGNDVLISNSTSRLSVGTASLYTGMGTRLFVGHPQNSTVVNENQFISVGVAGGSTNQAGINFLVYNAQYGGRIYTDDLTVRGLAFDVLQLGTFYNAMNITRTTSPNVLIGTTTDSGEKLVVNGTIGVPFSSTIRVAGGGYTRNDIFQTGYNNVSDLKDFLILDPPGSSNGKIILGTGSYVSVGIGTNSPSSGLVVATYGFKWDSDVQYNQPAGNIFSNLGFCFADQENWIGLRGSYGSSTGSANLLLQANFRDVGSNAGHYVASQAISLGNADFVIGRLQTQVSASTAPAKVEQLRIFQSGKLKLNLYGSGTFTGTPTYNLGVDSSGNVIELPGGVVDGSGTANYVAKWSDANTLTDSVVYDNGTNVGIGTASPGAKLDVAGDIWLSETGRLQGRAYPYDTTVGSGADASTAIIEAGSTNAYRSRIALAGGNATDPNTIKFLTASAEQMRITADGNVLIGTTTNAGYKLDVTGNARVTDTLFVNTTLNKGKFNISGYDNGGINIIDQRTSSSNVLFYSSITFRDYYDSVVAASIDFYHNQYFGSGVNRLGFSFEGSERLTILRAGNVGIGTTTPSHSLTVSRTTEAAAYQININNDGGISDGNFTGIRFSQDSSGTTELGNVRLHYYSTGVTDLSFGNRYQTQALTIKNGGNVLIGTTTDAGYKLNVNGDVFTSSSYTLQSSADYGARVRTYAPGDANWGLLTYASDPEYHMVITGASASNGFNRQFRVYDRPTGNSRFVVNFDGSGVGIGNAAPNEKLEISVGNGVTGGLRINYAASATGEGMDITYLNNGATTTSFDSRYNSDSAVMRFRMKTAATAVNAMTILGNGNVLIGTTTDNGNKLRVEGTTWIAGNVFTNGEQGIELTWTGNTINDQRIGRIRPISTPAQNPYAGGLAFDYYKYDGSSYNWFEGMRLNGSGNVGIGTASPAAPLHVKNPGDNGGVRYTVFLGQNSTGYQNSFVASVQDELTDLGAGIVGTNTGSNLSFSTHPNGGALTERMRITKTGNVLIGTTTDNGARLRVDGGPVYFDNSSSNTSIVNSNDYSLQVTQSLATNASTFSESLFLLNSNQNDNNFVAIGMSTNGTDGQHHRVSLRALRDGNVGGQFQMALREAGTSNNVVRLTVKSNGNVLIGTTTDSGYKLDVVGDTRITSGSLGVGVAPNATDGRIDASNDIVAYQTSDQRLKENVTPIENALEKVKSLTGVEFDWIEEHKHIHGYEGHDTGVIAQQVQAVMPTAVRTNDSGYLSVRYEKMIALLIEGMKEQQKEIDELKKLIK